MRFKRKEQYIEAEQFVGDDDGLLPEGVLVNDNGYYVVTIHQQRAYLNKGDWVVPEPTNPDYHYPIKDEVMKLLYEPVVGS